MLRQLMFFIALISFISTNMAGQNTAPTFQSAEHSAAGDQIKLSFSIREGGSAKTLLSLENGLKLTYGNIIALADFFGDPDKPISSGATAAERQARFLAAYSLLAKDYAGIGEAKKILAVMDKEQALLDAGLKQGEKPDAVYRRISSGLNQEFNCATGGNCGSLWFLFPGRFLKLASTDFDHFGDDAWLSYEAGHQVALSMAIVASKTQDKQGLMQAYAMNAFASHYLSDRFTSGHIRTPRAILPQQVTPSILGSLLGHFMHDEENVYGVSAHNQRGNYWTAFGDGYYFTKQNQESAHILTDAMQASANEIFYAYTTGVMPADYVKDYLPIANEAQGKGQYDVTPLFYWDVNTKILYRRLDVSNPYDKRMTSDWWGWTTAILLVSQRGLSTEWQARVAHAGYGELGIKYGLITDKNIIDYVRSHKVNV